MPSGRARKQRDQRHPHPESRRLQDMPRTGSGARRVALLRMPHLPRLVAAQRSKTDVSAARAADRRKVTRLHFSAIGQCKVHSLHLSWLMVLGSVAASEQLHDRRKEVENAVATARNTKAHVLAIVVTGLCAVTCGATFLLALFRQFGLVEVAASLSAWVEVYFLSSAIGDLMDDRPEPNRT